ncbi:MAG: hypothetical protein EXR77_17135 [Myxococcales bacterium]|nr:hypothetical protein [Myxococcales bacterium]
MPSLQLASTLAHLQQHGYAILPSVLSSSEISELQAALTPLEAARPRGRNNFEGEHSTRVYSLAGKGS